MTTAFDAHRANLAIMRWQHAIAFQREIDQRGARPLDERAKVSLRNTFDSVFQCRQAIEQFYADVEGINWAADPQRRFPDGAPWLGLEELAYNLLADRNYWARSLRQQPEPLVFLRQHADATWVPGRAGLAIRYQQAWPHEGLWSSVPMWVKDQRHAAQGVLAGHLAGQYRWAVLVPDEGDDELPLEQLFLSGLGPKGEALQAKQVAAFVEAIGKGRAWAPAARATAAQSVEKANDADLDSLPTHELCNRLDTVDSRLYAGLCEEDLSDGDFRARVISALAEAGATAARTERPRAA